MATSQQKNRRSESSQERTASSRGNSRGGPTASQVARRAVEQLHELTSRDVESVTGLERTDDGWAVRLEVVEARRIPDSADILALYDIQVDDRAEMTGYRRLRRYARGHTGDDE